MGASAWHRGGTLRYTTTWVERKVKIYYYMTSELQIIEVNEIQFKIIKITLCSFSSVEYRHNNTQKIKGKIKMFPHI